MKGIEIRKPEQLQSVSSLIIPGGESTTMAKLAEYHNLVLFSEPQFHWLHAFLEFNIALCLYLWFIFERKVKKVGRFLNFISFLVCLIALKVWLRNFVGYLISRMFVGLFYHDYAAK